MPIAPAPAPQQPLCCWVWRHPRPLDVAGRCIGRTDLPVDRRKAKRLAHHIRQQARRHGLPRVIHTSPLRRCAAVGRVLRSWGWRHHVDPALLEMDFGQWDGRPWSAIDRTQVDAWCDDFLHHPPGGGEPLSALFQRVGDWVSHTRLWTSDESTPGTALGAFRDPSRAPIRLVVGHAGWMQALTWLCTRSDLPTQAAHWPVPPTYGQCRQLNIAQPPLRAADRPLPIGAQSHAASV